MDHSIGCAIPENRPCLGAEHQWSGWPGAVCLKCGQEDKNEICVGNNCTCSCHDEMWAAYEKQEERE